MHLATVNMYTVPYTKHCHVTMSPHCTVPSSQSQVSWIDKCPHFRGSFVYISMYIAVLIREVSLFQDIPYKGSTVHYTHHITSHDNLLWAMFAIHKEWRSPNKEVMKRAPCFKELTIFEELTLSMQCGHQHKDTSLLHRSFTDTAGMTIAPLKLTCLGRTVLLMITTWTGYLVSCG